MLRPSIAFGFLVGFSESVKTGLNVDIDRLYSAIVFLDDAQSEVELWFPDLDVTITPRAGALVLFANVKRDDYLAPEPRTRHAHRALGDSVVQHVRALETWVHLFPFREPHTWTCIAPHGAYWSGEHDDEASELGHWRARLATLRKERAALADTSGDCTDDAFFRRHFDFCGGRRGEGGLDRQFS